MKSIARVLAIAVAAFAAFSCTGFAEQPKAAEYRAALAAGRYYAEYSRVAEYENPKLQERSDKNSRLTREIFVADGDKRAVISTGGRYGNEMAIRMESAHVIGKLFRNATKNARSLRKTMKLDLLYNNGYYYQFFGKNKALRLSDADTDDIHADPKAAWQRVREMLRAPGFFLAFTLPESEDMRFLVSGTETIFSMPMTVDTYIIRTTSKEDKTELVSYAYKYYYDEKGDLRYVSIDIAGDNTAEKAIAAKKRRGKGESLGSYIRIDSFKSEIPPDIFAYPEDYKIYCIEPGSVNDLFCYGELVESPKDK